MNLGPLPDTYATTRASLQRIATHALARRRFALCGKFGLRAAPRGFGTPACGPEHEIVRISGTRVIRETTGATAATMSLDLTDATLADAAALVGVDLTEPFEAGYDMPPVGDAHACLELDPVASEIVHSWFAFAWAVLDDTLAALGPDASPSVVQLWPEHFDAGVDVAATAERRVNLGASPGDAFSGHPYLYVGPWDTAGWGDASYWNAPFGAVLTYDKLREADDPRSEAVAFLLQGVALLRS